MLQRVLVVGHPDDGNRSAVRKGLHQLRARLEGVNRKLWVVITTDACGTAFFASEWANREGINRVAFPASVGSDDNEGWGGGRAAEERDALFAGVLECNLVYVFPGGEAQAQRVTESAPYHVPVIEADRLDETFGNLFESPLETPEDEEEEDIL